jgi:polyhydroxybutyrate depolymerase
MRKIVLASVAFLLLVAQGAWTAEQPPMSRHILVGVVNDVGVEYDHGVASDGDAGDVVDVAADTQGPALTVKSPRSGQKITTPTVVVSGTASDASKGKNGVASVTVNGEKADGDTATGSGTASWSKSVDLSLGPNTINVVATDGLGHASAKSVTVTRVSDTKGPGLTVKTPTKGQKIAAHSVTVSGTASDASTGGNGIASVTVNGVRASGDTAEGKGTASWSITLDLLTKTITVIATDTQGQSTQKTITVNWKYRLRICDADPIKLEGSPGAKQSGGCVVNYTQTIADPAYIEEFGTDTVQRRYLVYAPKNLPQSPVPVVFMFPGKGTNAETAAFHMTQTRFETLADRDGFVVVYGNGLPFVTDGESDDGWMESGGDFKACFLEHSGEGIDVQYAREILDQLETELSIDRTRVYAAGVSAGGGMSFQLALEAPDLVAAVAPVVPLPFQPAGIWLFNCNPHPDCGKVPIAMLAATADPAISYEPGGSPWYPDAQYPGMEQTRDTWLSAMGISGAPTFESFPDKVKSDSYKPQSGVTDSYIELYKYPSGPLGSEFWYYRAVGAGHWWPNPTQMYSGLWETYGKTNQDIDFADQAWAFFQRHVKP